ncbi:hypothetical protein [Brevundimonas sp. FT23028]|uniref:hypothetical protein n=1 Tax=Brevundimonas sp. FT23028 TaxID=3393748 RepID=UPI003B5878AE
MLKTIVLAAALVVAATVVPVPGSDAQAARETYRQCIHNIDNVCLPQGPLGPILPEAGTPEYDDWQTCSAAEAERCASLPDAP